MVVSNCANITFYTNAGNIVRLSIPRARMNKTSAEAHASMEALLENGAIVTRDGIPRTIRSAELVQTERTIMV